ncbi:MAG TPA: hypothetical protein VGW32_04995 [Pyrinomonadaceae bacterium]|nr:hypothetical protein [Pyrinomonadaceae bacterium]
MQSPQEIEARMESRYRVFLILWVAMLISILLLLGLALATTSASAAPNPTLSFGVLGTAFTMVVLSFLIKQRTVQRAIEKHDVASLQSGYIVSYALCESAALFGLFDHFVTGSKYSYFSFALAVAGMLLHFPKKDHVRSTI